MPRDQARVPTTKHCVCCPRSPSRSNELKPTASIVASLRNGEWHSAWRASRQESNLAPPRSRLANKTASSAKQALGQARRNRASKVFAGVTGIVIRTARITIKAEDHLMPNRPKPHGRFPCPCCGADVSAGAHFCRECGASEDSGWNEADEEPSGGYAEDDDFDYDDFIRREFPGQEDAGARHRLKRAFFVAVVLLVCLAFVLWMFVR